MMMMVRRRRRRRRRGKINEVDNDGMLMMLIMEDFTCVEGSKMGKISDEKVKEERWKKIVLLS